MGETVCGCLEGTQKSLPDHLHPMPEKKTSHCDLGKGQDMKW